MVDDRVPGFLDPSSRYIWCASCIAADGDPIQSEIPMACPTHGSVMSFMTPDQVREHNESMARKAEQ